MDISVAISLTTYDMTKTLFGVPSGREFMRQVVISEKNVVHLCVMTNELKEFGCGIVILVIVFIA
jgi:hypothetical protein